MGSPTSNYVSELSGPMVSASSSKSSFFRQSLLLLLLVNACRRRKLLRQCPHDVVVSANNNADIIDTIDESARANWNTEEERKKTLVITLDTLNII